MCFSYPERPQRPVTFVIVETNVNSGWTFLSRAVFCGGLPQDEYKGEVREGAAHSSFQNAPHTHLLASLSRRSRNFKYFSSQSYALHGVCKLISPLDFDDGT